LKPLTKEEKRKTLDAFSAYDDEPELEIVGRSEAEAWATCPMQASLSEAGKEGPLPGFVETGEQVHQAFGKAIQAWIDTDGEIGPQGIRDALTQALRGSRPDLQPQVIAAARASIWSFAAELSQVNPANILHFDGGEDRQSGQLAMDLDTAGVRFTAELDLLWAGPAKGVLQLEDYKSGWRYFRGWDVFTSFQFQSYAVLILDNYPEAQAVECRVWNTRQGTKTYPVTFERDKLDNYLSRIHAALQSRYEHKDNPVPWPTVEKCERCHVARHCSASGDVGAIAADPAAALREYIALGAKYGALGKMLTAHVKANGEIQLDTGERFASEHKSKPKVQLIAPPKGKTKKEESNDDDSDGE
jgi:hypothetical protein